MGVEFRLRDYRAEERACSLPRRRADTHPLSAHSPSALQVSGVLAKGTKGIGIFFIVFPLLIIIEIFVEIGKSSRDLHSGELDDSKNFDEEDDKVVSQQECLSKLQELKDEINQSWLRDDHVTSLRLSIKVARLLMDASIIQFYPTLFVLATDIMDMLVVPLSVPLWQLVYDVGYEPVTEKVVNQSFQERIEYAVSMTSSVVNFEFITISSCSMNASGYRNFCNNFKPSDVCFDAKETCNNWLSKVGSVRELLPRIYLELAILPCWRFLHNHPENNLQRLVMMVRGIADPLASAYCRLYLVQCAQRLPQYDTGGCGRMGRDPSTLFENCSCISIFLHYILKELPIGYICFNAMEILHLIECTDDNSFDQCLNFKLLGHRLCERVPELNSVHLIVDKITQEMLVHSSNKLAVRALRHGNNSISFVKSCLAFNEVTVPAIPSVIRQFKLYLETAEAVRGKMALEACNCVASSFKMCGETLEACSKLVEIAKACSPAADRFLQSTLKFLDAHQFLV
ncbi:UNVERIFIED_CONTAM: VPS35 endosomal protein sorting factor-like [Sesamum calycinum]|uniref:VPS35 endosomal protein sorting factor-like n=1 Tax=Sesamum calycinum TaxID=2727403 RepID=A0AAW2Q4W7_9LAMI